VVLARKLAVAQRHINIALASMSEMIFLSVLTTAKQRMTRYNSLSHTMVNARNYIRSDFITIGNALSQAWCSKLWAIQNRRFVFLSEGSWNFFCWYRKYRGTVSLVIFTMKTTSRLKFELKTCAHFFEHFSSAKKFWNTLQNLFFPSKHSLRFAKSKHSFVNIGKG